MAEQKQTEFFLVRYTPDTVKSEFVNIGVVMWEAGAGERGYAEVRFTRDWRRVRCMDPDADVEMLAAMEEAIRKQLTSERDRGKLIRFVEESFSNVVQVTPTTGLLVGDPAAEIERLATMYLEATRRQGVREAAGRQIVLGQMRDAFERAGVWPLMKKRIAASRYTRSGDPLKIDCGYQPNGVVKLFHAVSLATDVDSAKVLAFSFPEIAAGIERVDNAKAELTAIVEADADRNDEQVGFAIETLERRRIRVAGAGEMDKIAEQARTELRI